MGTKLRLFALMTSLSVAACQQEATGPSGFAALRTDQTVYFAAPAIAGDSLSRRIIVTFQYANSGAAPIYLETCPGSSRPIYGWQPTDANGVPLVTGAGSATAPCSTGNPTGTPLVVAGHSVRTDSATLMAPVSLPATVRFIVLATGCANVTDACASLLPDEDRATGAVQIRAAP
jgi:hypothetical protein